MSTSKAKDYIFSISFGAYIAAVLWITLFSRFGNEYRGFLLPFHSYVEILKGDWKFLLENIGNVVLFVPFGIVLKSVGIEKLKRAAVVGSVVSLLVETLQFTFALGTFECDDLFHNTLGVVIGAWCVGKIGGEIKLSWRVVLLSMVLCSMVPFSYREIRHPKIGRIAALYDREDGTENILVLNGKDGFAWDTDV